jgi:hypothetical protein
MPKESFYIPLIRFWHITLMKLFYAQEIIMLAISMEKLGALSAEHSASRAGGHVAHSREQFHASERG